MQRKRLVIGAVVLGLILMGVIVKTKFFSRPKTAAISVSATPKSVVFIDGVSVGTTPYLSDKIEAGERIIKIVPEDKNLLSWEGKVNLSPNILTVVNRTLGQTESASSGEVIWLEKIASRDKSSLSIISVPDQSVVKIEGEPKGFTPILLDNLPPVSYQIVVASPGYEERSIPAKTVAGYKLIINVQLAQKNEEIQEVTPSAERAETTVTPAPTVKITPKPIVTGEPKKPYLKIKETPTGWLRVRMAPSSTATEAAKVNPGEAFPYLNEKKGGWYKIEYEEGKEGWVSGVYVELIE